MWQDTTPHSSLPLSTADREHVLQHTSALWEEWGPARRLFITGGTGFFGCWLLETFAHANTVLRLRAQVAVLTRDPDAFRRRLPHLAVDPSIALVRGDVRSLDVATVHDQLREAGWPEIATHGFGAVLHAATAAVAAPGARDVERLFQAEISGTERTLAFARETGAKRFLFTSSGAVYGPQPDAMPQVTEDYSGAPDPMGVNATYGEGKRASELLCACAARRDGLAATVARAFAFVGPHLPLDGHFAIGNFLGDRIAGKPIQVKGDGKPVRSYLYAADLAVWLWTILFRGAPGRAYNVGSEDACSVSEAAALVAQTEVPGVAPVPIEHAGKPGAAATTTLSSHGRYVPSTRRAWEELGLRQIISLPDSIRRTLTWTQSTRPGS